MLIPAAAAERPEREVGGTKASLLLIVVVVRGRVYDDEKCESVLGDGFEIFEIGKGKKKFLGKKKKKGKFEFT